VTVILPQIEELLHLPARPHQDEGLFRCEQFGGRIGDEECVLGQSQPGFAHRRLLASFGIKAQLAAALFCHRFRDARGQEPSRQPRLVPHEHRELQRRCTPSSKLLAKKRQQVQAIIARVRRVVNHRGTLQAAQPVAASLSYRPQELKIEEAEVGQP
jgi:hypothetical protein